ncbi:MAG: pyridoxamine 5'-phosphate oxidase family protein, partial [Alphaproteobacteria bacterium]|nr:pyridoxamine 5'-phosphate oxidase family protein [Alphaproteobacteria bacterium]
VTSIEALEEIYGKAMDRSLTKEIDYISAHYRQFIEAAPFVLLATVGPEGMDCSPRGDPAGFARVTDEKTVMMPDRRGNNRLDSLRNLVQDSRISLLFLIPGVNETMRINGTARIVTDQVLRDSFAIQGKAPATVIVTTVDRIYYQCPKALVRSKLWSPDAQIERSTLPTTGQMQRALIGETFDAETYDKDYPAHMKRTIY